MTEPVEVVEPQEERKWEALILLDYSREVPLFWLHRRKTVLYYSQTFRIGSLPAVLYPPGSLQGLSSQPLATWMLADELGALGRPGWCLRIHIRFRK